MQSANNERKEKRRSEKRLENYYYVYKILKFIEVRDFIVLLLDKWFDNTNIMKWLDNWMLARNSVVSTNVLPSPHPLLLGIKRGTPVSIFELFYKQLPTIKRKMSNSNERRKRSIKKGNRIKATVCCVQEWWMVKSKWQAAEVKRKRNVITWFSFILWATLCVSHHRHHYFVHSFTFSLSFWVHTQTLRTNDVTLSFINVSLSWEI